MTPLQPETKRMLGIVLREIEQTVLPDLNAAHAKTVASLIGQTLRNLITREEVLPQLIELWSKAEADLLAKAGCGMPMATPGDPVGYNHALTDALEAEVAARVGNGGVLDDVCRQAVEAESQFITAHAKAIAEVPLPQRGEQRRALLEVTPERLTDYIRRKLPQLRNPVVKGITPVLAGFSKQTLLIDFEANGAPMPLVMRRDLQGGSANTSVVDEYPIVAELYRRGLPVPRPVHMERDAGEFGEPFTITRRAPGCVVSNPVAGRPMDEDTRQGALELAAFLARLHSLKLHELDLPRGFHDPKLTVRDSLIKQIDDCDALYRRHRLQASPTFAAGLAWLRANVPEANEAPSVVHGDAGLNNMLMHEGRISVMVDWELVHPGDAGEDVCYTHDWVDRIMPFDEFLDHYHRCGGPRYHAEREKFYRMLADVRVGLYTVRIRDLLRQSDHPEIALLYGAQHYYGYFIQNIARNLLAS